MGTVLPFMSRGEFGATPVISDAKARVSSSQAILRSAGTVGSVR